MVPFHRSKGVITAKELKPGNKALDEYGSSPEESKANFLTAVRRHTMAGEKQGKSEAKELPGKQTGTRG